MVKIKKIQLLWVLLALLPVCISPSVAQEQGFAFGWKLLSNSEATPDVILRQRCFDGLSSECSETGISGKEQNCRLREERSLGKTGDSELVLFKFKHDWISSEGINQDVCRTEDIVIAERTAGSSTLTPVFADATDPDFAFVSDARVIHHDKGPFLSLGYCANGTGGCNELDFIRRDGHWRLLEKDATWGNVDADIPKGYAPHKSPYIDFEHLTWEQHLATAEDPNCCPSGRILYDLDIVNDKLSVRSFKVETGIAVQ